MLYTPLTKFCKQLKLNDITSDLARHITNVSCQLYHAYHTPIYSLSSSSEINSFL